jgi:sarcosine oxidase subunit beta
MSHRDFQKIQPLYNLSANDKVIYEHESGYANPQETTRSFLNQAKENGTEILEGVRVNSFKKSNGRILSIETNIGSIYADVYILTNSTWINELIEPLGVTLPVRKKKIGIGFMDLRFTEYTSNLTSYVDDTLDTYFRPAYNNHLLFGVKINEEEREERRENDFSFIHNEDLIKAKERLYDRLPFLKNAPITGTRLGFDSYTEDGLPLIGEIPGFSNLYSCVGFNGGGFKIAPSVAYNIAKEIISRRKREELAVCNINRIQYAFH